MPDGSAHKPAKRPAPREFVVSTAMESLFHRAPRWERRAAIATICRLRPDLGDVDDLDHEMHLSMWWRDQYYFGRVCAAFKLYGIGTDL